MTDILAAITRLDEEGIESFPGNGILVIPCDSPDDIYPLANKIRRIFKEIGFEKSWQIDPYYHQRIRHDDGSVVIGPEDFA